MTRAGLITLCVGVLVTACQSVVPSNGGSSRPDASAGSGAQTTTPTLSPLGQGAALSGSWRLMAVNGVAVKPDQLLITFAPQSFRATVNCNSVSGRYTLTGQRFTPEMAVATERGCGPEYSYDRVITRGLQTGLEITVNEDRRMELHSSDLNLVLVKVP